MKTDSTRQAKVTIDGGQIRLDVCYSIERGNERESDAASFTGSCCEDSSQEEVIQSLIQSAIHFANNLRAEGWEVACWDEDGNHF